MLATERRGYFNDLRIDAPVAGGGHLPTTLIHVRRIANAPNQSGNITLSSEGEELATLAVNTASEGGIDFASWSQFHNLDPLGSGAGSADPDGDGHTNLHEFLFGGNPNQGQGGLFHASQQQGGLVLTFLGLESSGAYDVLTTSNLVSGPWQTEQIVPSEAIDQSAVPAGYKRYQVTIPAPNGSRFYRLRGEISD